MKHLCKRALALVLALVMIIGMAPTMTLHAHAAGTIKLDDSTIGVSYGDISNKNGKAVWTGSGKSVTGQVTGYTSLGIFSRTATSTLTIKNNRANTATLKFNYKFTAVTQSSDYIKIGSQQTYGNQEGAYSIELAAGASLSIVQAADGSNTSILEVTDIQLIEDKIVTTTFLPGENGSYTVDGAEITASIELSKSSAVGYNLVATPAADYQFVSWYNETTGKYISSSATYTLMLEEAATVYPVFVPVDTAIFSVGGIHYEDLAKADTAASAGAKLIVVANNGILPAGDYTISSGNTLLIPYNSSNTVHTSGVSDSSTANNPAWVQPTAFRTLTMANGANITVNGAVNVGAIHHAANGGNPYGGSPTGPVGMIHMNSGSSMEVRNGGKLYAWGFIKGAGTISVKSGAEVYENMQITDFRGGSITTAVTNKANTYKVFPFSQYYVQNVEVAMTLDAGASLMAATSVYMSYTNQTATVKFIGSGGLFSLASGSVTKYYNGAEDRLELTINEGEVGIDSISMKVSSITINSESYVLPLNGNITFRAKAGSSVTMGQDMALMPGARVIVDEGATMRIPEGSNLYVYDADQWGTYVYTNNVNTTFGPVGYAPGRTYNRTAADVIVDVSVDLNGQLIVEGNAYTTAGGANIYTSQATGKVTYNAVPGTATHTYQVIQGAESQFDAPKIPVTPLKLHNGGGKYTTTADAVVGDTYQWNADCAAWSTQQEGHLEVVEIVQHYDCLHDEKVSYYCKFCGYRDPDKQDVVTEEAPGEHFFDPDDSGIDPDVIPPTCTEPGMTIYYCGLCDATLEEPIEATGHTEVVDAAVAPTCTATGLTEGKHCSVCGTVTVAQETVPTIPHTEVVDAAVEPTCDKTGLTEGKHCSDCGTVTVAQETVPTIAHTEEIIPGTPATCTTTGLTDGKKCTVCGNVTVAQEIIPTLAHTEEIIPGTPATCTTTGLTDGKKCSVCGVTTVEQTEIPALGHNYEAVVTEAPGCNEAGVMTYTCANCGDSYTEAIDATGHTEVVVEAVAPTCTATGLTEGTKCDVCDTVIVAQETVDALGHNYNAVVTAPTCTEVGYTTYTCANCGDTYTGDEVAALGHNYNAVVTAPTCTEAGYTTYTCANCGDTYTGDEVAATGHDYEAVVTAPTCTEVGYTTYTCANCGHSYTADEVAATGHVYEAVVTAPTCTENGYTTYTCANCGDSYTDNVVAATGHDYEAVVTAPTCTEAGYTTYTCANCGDAYTDDETEALGHDYSATVTGATCTEGGYTTYTCANCSHSYIADETAATGHNHIENVTAPTCTEAGYTTFVCICGDSYVGAEVPALGHTASDAVEENRVEATCTEAGSYDKVTYCSVCNVELNREKMEISPVGHSYENGSCVHCGEADPAAKIEYTFQQSSQLGLIEPWFLKSNLYVKVDGVNLTEAELNNLVDFGVYFVRASDLGNPTELPTVEDIVNAEAAVKYSKGNAEYPAKIEKGGSGYMITASYVEGIYTYELNDSVYALFYIEDANGITYDVVKDRNLLALAQRGQTQTNFDPTEKDVYTRMIELYEKITEHRATFSSIPAMSTFNAPKVQAGQFGEYQTGLAVNHSTQIVLIEPWGMRLNGYVSNSLNMEDSGVVVFYDKNDQYTAAPSVDELVNNPEAYVLSTSNGSAKVEASGSNWKITADYTKEIYTYQLNDNAYAVFFVKIDGVYHFGEVKTRNVLSMIEGLVEKNNSPATELAVYEAMINMHYDVVAHRANFVN